MFLFRIQKQADLRLNICKLLHGEEGLWKRIVCDLIEAKIVSSISFCLQVNLLSCDMDSWTSDWQTRLD